MNKIETKRGLAAATRLYAFVLRLRSLQQGTLMPFSGALVHGAFLRWLRGTAPDVSMWLHDGNKRRLFTCSSLQFGWPPARILPAERENVHLPLDPQKTYAIRITLLLGELFPLLKASTTSLIVVSKTTEEISKLLNSLLVTPTMIVEVY